MLLIAAFSKPTVAILLISFANLALLVVAANYRDKTQVDSRSLKLGRISMVLVGSSQLIYLLFIAVRLFSQIRFYSDNPIVYWAIVCGLLLCISAAITAFWGAGLKRCASLFVATTVAGMWFLTAIAFAAG